MHPSPVAIVTGAARGIGKACADALAAAGFAVLRCDLVAGEGVYAADVADLATHEALLDEAFRRWGRLDCLVNNAGVGAMRRGDLLDVTPESFDRCLAVNTRAMFFLTQAAARRMLQAAGAEGPRSIIQITSSNAIAASISRGEYCVSKAASSMTTQLFAVRLAASGIGVYEIRPGLIDTEMTRPVHDAYTARLADEANPLVPEKRWGQPDDVAAMVRLLAEGRVPYATGQVFAIDGGMTLLRY